MRRVSIGAAIVLSFVVAFASAPSLARACGCLFLACGQDGRPHVDGVRVMRWWSITAVLSEDGVAIERVRVATSQTPVLIPATDGSYAIDVLGRDETLARQRFSFGAERTIGLRRTRTQVRVPFHADAIALRIGDGYGGRSVEHELPESREAADSLIVDQLSRQLGLQPRL